MSIMSQDTSFKPQDRQDALEKLVPKLDLCKQIPPGAFENSALVWSYSCDKRKTEPFIEERDCIDFCRRNMVNAPPVYPAPTLAEIIEAIKTKTYCKDDLCDHKYDLHYCAIDLKWIFCFGENFAVADTLSSAALKLWLELNKSDQSDTDRKGGE